MPRRRRSVAPVKEIDVMRQELIAIRKELNQVRQAGPSTIQSDRLLDVADPIHGQVIMNYPGIHIEAEDTDPLTYYHGGDAVTPAGWKAIKGEPGSVRPLPFVKLWNFSGLETLGAYNAGAVPLFHANTNPIKWVASNTFNLLDPNNVPYITFDATNGYPKFKKGIYDLKFQMSIDPSASGALPNYHWLQTRISISAASGYAMGDNIGGPPGSAAVVITQAEAVVGADVQWAVSHHTTLAVFSAPAIDAVVTCSVTPASGGAAQPVAANFLITRLGDID